MDYMDRRPLTANSRQRRILAFSIKSETNYLKSPTETLAFADKWRSPRGNRRSCARVPTPDTALHPTDKGAVVGTRFHHKNIPLQTGHRQIAGPSTVLQHGSSDLPPAEFQCNTPAYKDREDSTHESRPV